LILDILPNNVDRGRRQLFLNAAVRLFKRRLPSFLYAYVQAQLDLIPEVKPDVCTACEECAAISLAGRTAKIDEAEWLHCLCCHEVCLHRAVRLKPLPLGKLIRKARNI
jgi:heterodisulfide reductase subunit A-like polyferredoxin